MLSPGPADKANSETYLELNFFKEQRTENGLKEGKEFASRRLRDSLQKLNLRPSQGTKTEKVRRSSPHDRLVTGPDQVLSWDLLGVPGKETSAIPEPFAQHKSWIPSWAVEKSTFHFKCVQGVVRSE